MSDEQPPTTPKYMGTQWFILGWLMIVVPIWTIVNNIYSGGEILGITVFSLLVICAGGWVLYVGVGLIIKYDIKQ